MSEKNLDKNTKKIEKSYFVFEKENYKWLIIGFSISIIGFFLMAGGAAESPDVFNEDELFSFRRITLAPILVIAGYGVILYSILKKPAKKTGDQ